MQAHGALHADIVERQHIWARHVKNQKHFGGPAADATNLDQLGNNVFVFH